MFATMGSGHVNEKTYNFLYKTPIGRALTIGANLALWFMVGLFVVEAVRAEMPIFAKVLIVGLILVVLGIPVFLQTILDLLKLYREPMLRFAQNIRTRFSS